MKIEIKNNKGIIESIDQWPRPMKRNQWKDGRSALLLADFVSITARCKNICDLCTGNAPIPLYLTLRCKANILGVEVQKHSYDLAIDSVKVNNLSEQITIINDNLIDISKKNNKHQHLAL